MVIQQTESSEVMEPNQTEIHRGLLDRLRKSWFPPAAVVGALGAFIAAARRGRPGATPSGSAPGQPQNGPTRAAALPAAAPSRRFDRQYRETAGIGSKGSPQPFQRSLRGIAVGESDRIYSLGDDHVRVYEPDGTPAHSWKAPAGAQCIATGPDGKVYLGCAARLEIYDAKGRRCGGFVAGEAKRAAEITAVELFGEEILLADAAARVIRRYDQSGRQIGDIGTQNKTRNFILPNRWLDFAVDANGVVHAADSGRHRVTSWGIEGAPRGQFGKFGHINPEDFVGCCNPVNIAVTPRGEVVTAEKAPARVKVYAPGGKLLALIGPENFDPNCTNVHLAVDSKGRIVAGDPVRRVVKIFAVPPTAAEG
jgi:hypothetical protein